LFTGPQRLCIFRRSDSLHFVLSTARRGFGEAPGEHQQLFIETSLRQVGLVRHEETQTGVKVQEI